MARGNLFGVARAASEYVRRRMSRSVQRADEVSARVTGESEQTNLKRRIAKLVFGRRSKFKVPPGSPGYDHRPGAPPVMPPGYDDHDQRTGSPPIVPPIAPPYPPPDDRSPPNQPPPPPPPEKPPLGDPGGESDPPPDQPPPPPKPPKEPDQPPPPPPGKPPLGFPDGDDGDDIELLGRDASYHKGDWAAVMDGMRLTPGSSNVFGYYFEFESRTQGILYVTFLAQLPGGKRGGAGTTYAYYDVPGRKYHQFAKASDSSAGGAVWDYLRIRGTIAGHQHNYRLIQSHGDYIPRKATPKGFRTRHVADVGKAGRRAYRRSTLPERLFARPDRGKPDRGTPDRGDAPDRGSPD